MTNEDQIELARVSLRALRAFAEAREEGIAPHLERIGEYAGILAEKLPESPGGRKQLDLAFLEHFREVCPLYDIGKGAIPDVILLKPARLTPEEFEIIKTHPAHGVEFFRSMEERLQGHPLILLGIQIIESHHEKWDGTGYPKGLTGEAIPLAARIVALADVYDALMSRRSYRTAFFHNEARKMILEGRGRHFDPALVDCFLSLENEFLQIRRAFQDFPMG